MSKLSINIIVIIAACVVLFFLSNQLVSQKKVPSLGDIIASSTEIMSSSTEAISSSTESSVSVSSSTESSASSTGIISNSVQKLSSSTQALSNLSKLPSTTVFTSKGSLKVFIANTDVTREQGLSDLSSLPEGEGELFVFDSAGAYGFWMKDMNFPLDMVWVDSNKVITNITKNATPDSYPSVFMPVRPILYVLEINAGTSEKLGFISSKQIHFSLP